MSHLESWFSAVFFFFLPFTLFVKSFLSNIFVSDPLFSCHFLSLVQVITSSSQKLLFLLLNYLFADDEHDVDHSSSCSPLTLFFSYTFLPFVILSLNELTSHPATLLKSDKKEWLHTSLLIVSDKIKDVVVVYELYRHRERKESSVKRGTKCQSKTNKRKRIKWESRQEDVFLFMTFESSFNWITNPHDVFFLLVPLRVVSPSINTDLSWLQYSYRYPMNR